MGGHVFVARSDLTKLRCNAWLLPTDRSLGVTPAWREAAKNCGVSPFPTESIRTRWERRASRTLAIDPWWEGLGKAPAPIPILTDVGGWSGSDVRWYLDGLSEFIEEALQAVPEANGWRTKALFGLPLIGTGQGGQNMRKGAMEQRVLERLAEEADRHNVDLALVLASDAAYSAAQRTRSRANFAEAGLTSEQLDLLDTLAQFAKAGHLVLFAGAGLSKSAGLPLWPELLANLAADAGLTPEESKALAALPLIDGASILEKRLAAKNIDLRTMAMKATTSPCFGIGHAVLAGLPVSERVTTNYDDLIEQSLDASGKSAAVLPYDPSSVSNGWLLKLHGSTANAIKSATNDIVLTRQDYLRYDGRRGALYGIVQALLLTRQILFVGFSLEDDNFYALVDEVRRAVEGTNGTPQLRSPFGTALVPSGKLLMKELWEREVHIEVIGDFPSYPRALEVALDYLGCKAASNLSHLFDPTFAEILNDEEKRLRDAVGSMRKELGDISGATFETTREFFRDLGVPLDHPATNKL